jgi:serine/threonine-protein kinase
MNETGKVFRFILKLLFAVIIIIFIVGAGVLSGFLVYENAFYVHDTVVPSVVGDELEVAQKKLYEVGLKINISGEEFNEKITQNKVIKQDPISGKKIKKNREVNVIISKGIKVLSLEIPDLKNKELKEAISILEEYKLKLGKITYTYHFTIPKDKVIAQMPESGEVTSNNNTVNLLVSKGHY